RFMHQDVAAARQLNDGIRVFGIGGVDHAPLAYRTAHAYGNRGGPSVLTWRSGHLPVVVAPHLGAFDHLHILPLKRRELLPPRCVEGLEEASCLIEGTARTADGERSLPLG